MTSIILATPDVEYESELVRVAETHGLHVVRRCLDAADMLAFALSDTSAIVVMSAGLPRLTRDVVVQLRQSDRVVVGIFSAAGPRPDLPLVNSWIPRESDAAAMAAQIAQVVQGLMVDVPPDDADPAEARSHAVGELIAVWGPHGSPGRTSIAIGIADAIAARGMRVGLVDADTEAAAVGFALGITDRPPGLLGACRRVEHASLDVQALSSCCRRVHDWSVLTGLDGAHRGAHIRAASLDVVQEACRSAFDVTIVDTSAGLTTFDTGPWGAEPNLASRSLIAHADRVVVVADASALGAARLASQWPELMSCATSSHVTIVRNRVRRGGPRRWSEALHDHGIGGSIVEVAERRRELEACWAHGRTPRELRQARGWSRSMKRLAEVVMRH